ncbi:hypothetical protein [Sphingomonas prati]|uniref:Uncharacterized protein n=1 Tax=Sphingomonas prati TaxID=1843237 RepID=A0A7W9BRV8_9SPHN|nr:hypothetical protein [Sphingomonas prati]MBB5728890.1 hypothetical protein [Sphingomonas prati]GGE86789.1 hypothetical protein GCM10011404_19410 [Sphingomonas prati]
MIALFALAAVTNIAAPTPRPGWFLCDSVDVPVAALVGPVERGQSLISTVSRGTGKVVTRRFAVGPAEAGMSQIHYPLTLAGRPAGDLHYVQPAVLADPTMARTPTFTSVTLDGRTMGCRWVANTVFMGLTARRSFLVTEDGRQIVYRSFDAADEGKVVQTAGLGRSNAATLTVGGGVRSRVGKATRFRFVNRGYRYDVTVPDTGAARVSVSRSGRLLQTETLLGYTLAKP